jgi:hypothetical protein
MANEFIARNGIIAKNNSTVTGSLDVTSAFTVQTYDSFISNAYVNAIQITDNNRTLYDIFGNTSIDAGGRILTDMNALPSANWMARTLFDSSTSPSINWGFRYLYNSSGSISLNWETGILTGSLFGTASYATRALSASYTTQALSASYAPGGGNPFPYNGNAQISGSLGVTGSFSVLNSIDATNKVLIGVGGVSGSTANSVNWDSRTLFDSNGNFSIRWGGLRTMFDTNVSQSIDWNTRQLKIDNGSSAYTVDWGSGILRDTGVKNSVDWQNRTTIDTGNKNSIDWQNRQLKDSSGNQNLNWSSGVSITGSLTVSGSSTFTNIGPARFSGSFIVQGDLIPGSPPYIPNFGPYDAIKVDDIAGQRLLYGTPYQGASASIDFGNRTLYTSDGGDALSWSGQTGTYRTYLYNQQYINETNRGNLFGYNSLSGQILGDSYFDTAVTDNDLVYLNTDGQWYQVNQTTNTSTKMLGIAKYIFSQTGSVVIEGDIVVTTATGYPAVANAGYGLPVYIKQGAGTAMNTAKPVSGYVRSLGHCYWRSGGGGTEWIMKFRPSNDWYVI